MFQLNFFQQFALLTKPYKCQKLQHLDVLREKKITSKSAWFLVKYKPRQINIFYKV